MTSVVIVYEVWMSLTQKDIVTLQINGVDDFFIYCKNKLGITGHVYSINTLHTITFYIGFSFILVQDHKTCETNLKVCISKPVDLNTNRIVEAFRHFSQKGRKKSANLGKVINKVRLRVEMNILFN